MKYTSHSSFPSPHFFFLVTYPLHNQLNPLFHVHIAPIADKRFKFLYATW